MSHGRQCIADLVRSAFHGVRLGNGVGLRQGQGLDDYADAETLAAYRAGDEKEEWSRIPASDLDKWYSSLSFFDAEGMRFHLPAYLIADLVGGLHADLLFTLTCFDFGNMSRFASLNQAQRNAIRQYLLLRLAEVQNNEFVRPMLEKALTEYWTSEV